MPLRKTPRPPIMPDKGRSRAGATPRSIWPTFTPAPACKACRAGRSRRCAWSATSSPIRAWAAKPTAPGLDGPWDIKSVLGTVPVCEDGSARFRVPAYTPIALQPLDGEGKAVQLMRSWFTAMPGEVVSCVGCHEKQNTAPPARPTHGRLPTAAGDPPWYGPARGFDFRREVQPVLDKHCIGCHDGAARRRCRI